MSNLNKVSEIVGNGHPDKIADKISWIVALFFNKAGIETLIRCRKNVVYIYIMGDIEIPIHQELGDIEENIKIRLENELDDIVHTYGFEIDKYDFQMVFVEQDSELNSVSKENLSGDQEIVFHVKHPLHDELKQIKGHLDKTFNLLDWKLLIDKENKVINFSCSKTSIHKVKSISSCLMTILESLDYSHYKLNYCWFEGGSIFNDVGVTGRKLIADGDGCGAPHGGGAWSGKDNTKAAVAGRNYLIDNDIEGAAIYIPRQKLNKPTIIKNTL